jgi:hypothetical protein
MRNTKRLDSLFQEKTIQLDRGALFDNRVTPKSSNFDFDRVEGPLLVHCMAEGGCRGVGLITCQDGLRIEMMDIFLS